MDTKAEVKETVGVKEPVGWHKFDLRVIRNPLLKRFRIAQRWRIMQVLSLACDWGNLGVIAQYDDEIAAELDITLEDWIVLCDKLLLHDIMRQVERENGRRAYEISYLILPYQGPEKDQRSPEAFQPATWQLPQMPLSSEGTESKRILDMLPASLGPDERRLLLGAARTAYSKACAKARNNKYSPPDRDTFMWEYFNTRVGDVTPFPAPEQPLNGNAPDEDFGNASESVTGNANAPYTTRKDENEIDNNNSEGGNGNALKREGSVTVTENVVVVFSDSSNASEQAALSPEDHYDTLVDQVVSLLTSPNYGVTETVIREELIPRYGLGRCIEQLAYFQYAPPRDNPGGHLANAIRTGYAAPPGYRKRKDQQKQERNRRRNEARKAEKAAATQQNQSQDNAQADAYYESQGPEQQFEIAEAARTRFREKNNFLFQKWERSAGEPSQMLQEEFLRHRRAICRERLRGLEGS